MKIVSKHKDYYDCVLQHSQTDNTCVFERHTVKNWTLPKYQPKLKFISNFLRDKNEDRFWIDNEKTCRIEKNKNCDAVITYGIVGFCGEIYPFVRVKELLYQCEIDADIKVRYFYTYKNLEEEYPNISNATGRRYRNRKVSMFCHSTYQDWFDTSKTFISQWKNVFSELKCAYFVVDKNADDYYLSNVCVYPVLADYQFYKVLDPYFCFQKLEMYLTNELQPPDLVEMNISDKLKVGSHGFNKWSFRKKPTKHKI